MATGGANVGNVTVNADGEILDNDARVQIIFVEMNAHQNEIDALRVKANKEIIKIEHEYHKLKKPIYEKRHEICRKFKTFWLMVFAKTPLVAEIIDEADEQCLNYLTKLEVEYFEDCTPGYRLKFHFKENPYFENDVIVKKLDFDNEISQSTYIQWKDNMEPVRQHRVRRVPRRRCGHIKRRHQVEPRTFFEWFTDYEDPKTDSIASMIKSTWENLRNLSAADFELEDDIGVEGNEREAEPMNTDP